MRIHFHRTISTSFSIVLCMLVSSSLQVSAQDSIKLQYGDISLTQVYEDGAGKGVSNESQLAFHTLGEQAYFGSKYHLVLQFDQIVSSKDRKDLEAQGVFLEQYIARAAYLARVNSNIDISRLLEKGLTAYGIPGVSNKMSGSFRSYLRDSHSERVLVRASYSNALSTSVVGEELNTVLGESTARFSERAPYVAIDLEVRDVLKLAGLPFIYSIEPHSEEVEFEGLNTWAEYVETSNADVQSTQSRANVIKSSNHGGLGLSGEGVIIGMGDAIYQGETHVDLRGRRVDLEPGLGNNGSFSYHGNHTASIAAGNGAIRPRFEGLAPEATVYSMRTGDHFSLGLQQTDPMVISSNSWNSSDPVYGGDFYENKGRYNIKSQAIDLLLRNERTLLSVFSAGNSGGRHSGYPDDYLTLNPSYGSAKNTLVVGRQWQPQYFFTSSSYGPARDGRIKPDIIAQNQVYSATAFNDYASMQGSSQSTPAISGIAALLYEHYRNLYAGSNPDGALIKSILMNTADYLVDAGPTYAAGYGTVNARRAAEVVTSTQFTVASVENGNTNDVIITVPPDIGGKSISKMKVMLYWTDKEASPYASKALVNNLDLEVNGAGSSHLPWVLDSTRTNVELPATRGVDSLNNTEQVLIESPASGTYTATISGTEVPFGPQEFYLVYSFVLDELVITHPLEGDAFFSGQSKIVFWDTQDHGEARAADAADYTLDDGASWISFRPNWSTPRSSIALTIPQSDLLNARVRISQGGRTVESAPFTISEPIALSIEYPTASDVRFNWNDVAGAASYELLQLNDSEEWEVFQSVADTSIVLSKALVSGRSRWLSVRAVDAKGEVTSQRANAVQFVSSNSMPTAQEDIIYLSLNEHASLDLLANDSDDDGDSLYITEISTPSHGSATLQDNQLVNYSTNDGYTGLDSFTYTVVDGFGGSASGTVTLSVASGVASENEVGLPSEFRLEANYPNPFNPSTSIRYALPQAAPVTLSVFDTLGRRVAVLIDSSQQAGWHNFTFDAGTLSSGMYFYRLDAGDVQLTRSMFLLK
jgi:hypothetical protein